MDRGYISEELMDELHLAGYRFVIPVRRNSSLYDTVEMSEKKGFSFRGDAVFWEKGEGMGYNAYRFENQGQRNEELAGMMGIKGSDEEVEGWGNGVDPYDIDGDPSKAGNLILGTNLEEDPELLYTMFKMRCSVEECNDTFKNVLSGDSTYLRDNVSIMGFNFVSFLALRMYMTIELWIAEKGMTSRYTPADVLFEYGSMVSVTAGNRVMIQKTPANVLKIEEDLALDVA